MVEEISSDELWDRIQNGDAIQIVDIRPETEFEAGHIPGAENIPFYNFAREVGDHEWEDSIVVTCPMGESSLQAARLLESYEAIDEDTSIANLEGGYGAWSYDLEQHP